MGHVRVYNAEKGLSFCYLTKQRLINGLEDGVNEGHGRPEDASPDYRSKFHVFTEKAYSLRPCCSKPLSVPPRKHHLSYLRRWAVQAYGPAVSHRVQVTQRRVVIFHAIGVKSGLQEYLHNITGAFPLLGERDWFNFDNYL